MLSKYLYSEFSRRNLWNNIILKSIMPSYPFLSKSHLFIIKLFSLKIREHEILMYFLAILRYNNNNFSVLTMCHSDQHCCYCHFIDGETEAQRDCWACLRIEPVRLERVKLELDSGNVTPKCVLKWVHCQASHVHLRYRVSSRSKCVWINWWEC